MNTMVGDKVRVKAGEHAGARGVVAELHGKAVAVQLDEAPLTVTVPIESLTNLSEAARKAWLSQPGRRVGRRKGTRLCDRVSVTLRIDREVWQQFRSAEASGLIEDRTRTINRWLRERLHELEQGESPS